MKQVALENLSDQLIELVQEVRRGGEVLFTQHNLPVARLVMIESPRMPRKPGSAKHLPHFMAEDFNTTPEGFEEYMP